MTASRQPGNNILSKQSVDILQQDLSLVAGSVLFHGDILPQGSQDVTTENKDHVTQLSNQKPSVQAPVQLLKAHLLQQTSSHIQVFLYYSQYYHVLLFSLRYDLFVEICIFAVLRFEEPRNHVTQSQSSFFVVYGHNRGGFTD